MVLKMNKMIFRFYYINLKSLVNVIPNKKKVQVLSAKLVAANSLKTFLNMQSILLALMNKISIKLLREIRKIFFRNIRILSKIKNIKILKVNAENLILAKTKKKLATFLIVSWLEITKTSKIEIIKLWIMKLKKNILQGKEVKLVYNNNLKE